MTKTEFEARYKDFKLTKLPTKGPKQPKKTPLFRPLYYHYSKA